MSAAVLQLNADYTPMKVQRYERAIELLLEEKAMMVVAVPERFIHSEKLVLPFPSVIALRRFNAKGRPDRIKFSGRAVQARDNHTCCYCGVRPTLPNGRPDRDALTMDHVVPRAQSKDGKVYLYWVRRWSQVTTWENCVCACRRCNQRKADQTPQQAGLTLRWLPRRPTAGDSLRMALWRQRSIPEEWEPWIPKNWSDSHPEADGEGVAAVAR